MFSTTAFKQASFNPVSFKFLGAVPPVARGYRVRSLGLGMGLCPLPR